MTEKSTEIKVKREAVPTVGVPASDWEPIRSLRHQIDRLLSDFDWPDLRAAWPQKAALSSVWPDFATAVPPVDLVERDGGYELQAELPGLSEDQIDLKLANGMLTIKGEKSSERVEDKDNYHLRERNYGSFQRAFRVPANVDTDKIEARFDKGVLKISLPKSASAILQERKINVKAV